ncbi:MAG TPA: hypothetical protein VF435_06645 [Pyrinomonadaceae bacterium]
MTSNHIRVLVLMPMLPGYEAVRQTVAATIADAKLEIVLLEELLEDWEWLDWLYASVRECDIVLANPSKHNAFVMYELGVARVDARPTLIVLDREDSQLSGSLDGSPFLLYSNDELDLFSDQLRADLSGLARVSHTRSVVNPREFYRDAVNLLKSFTDETGRSVEAVDEDAFTTRLNHSMNHGTFIPSLAGTRLGDTALLAALIRSSRMVDTMTAIREWVDLRTHD